MAESLLLALLGGAGGLLLAWWGVDVLSVVGPRDVPRLANIHINTGVRVFTFVLSLVSTLVFYGCYAFIVVATARGRLSLGQLTLYLVAFRQGQQCFQSILWTLSGMYEDTLYMSNLFEYLAIPTSRDAPVLSAAPRAVAPLKSRPVNS